MLDLLIPLMAAIFGFVIGGGVIGYWQRKQSKKRVAEALQEQAKLVATAGFILRTPLNHLLGFVSSLTARSHNYSDDDKALIGKLLGAGGELKKALIDVLDVFELETRKLEVVRRDTALHQMLNTAIKVGQKTAEKKRLYLKLQMDPKAQAIFRFDDTRVRQCLDNLIAQALDQTIRGGVTVTATIEPMPKDTENQILTLVVKDTSPGMDQYLTEFYFNPANKASPKFLAKDNAARVNLALTKGLAKLMGGDVTAKSAIGSGVKFTFTTSLKWVEDVEEIEAIAEPVPERIETEIERTPVISSKTVDSLDNKPTPKTEGVPANPAATAKEYTGRSLLDEALRLDMLDLSVSERGVTRDVDVNSNVLSEPEKIDLARAEILTVDDNQINLEVLKVYLQHLGAVKITEAESGPDALEMINNKSFDVVFMDMHMPGLTGTETTKKIRQLHPAYKSTPIIACTAAVDSSTRRDCRESGMDNFLPKPVNIEELKTTLQNYFVV